MPKLGCAFANLVKTWCQKLQAGILMCRGSMVPLRADVTSSPREITWPWSGIIKTPLKYTWEHCILQLQPQVHHKAQTADSDTDPLAHPKNCSHFVLICRTIDQKWERRLNNCSVLKWLYIGKVFGRENNNQMLPIFFTQISQSGE